MVQLFSRTCSKKIASIGGGQLKDAEISLDNREKDVVSVNFQLKSSSESNIGNILSYINKLWDKTITGDQNGALETVDDVPEVEVSQNCALSKILKSRMEQIASISLKSLTFLIPSISLKRLTFKCLDSLRGTEGVVAMN